MHNATTKQRLAALRRKLGIFIGAPRWVRERRKRLMQIKSAAAAALRPFASYADSTETLAAATASSDATAQLTEAGAPVFAPAGLAETEAGTPAFAPAGLAETEAGTPAFAPAGLAETEAAGPRAIKAPSPAPDASRDPMAAWKRTRLVAFLAAAVVLALAGLVAEVVRSPARSVRGSTPAAAPAPKAQQAATTVPADGATPAAATAATPVAAAEPAPAPAPTGVRLEVRSGDSLWRLAATHLGDPQRWPELHELNRDRVGDPDLIFPGQLLRVPGR
jgi:LysM repeat protein